MTSKHRYIFLPAANRKDINMQDSKTYSCVAPGSYSRHLARAFTVAMCLGVATASAQEFPSKPIRIVTSGAGGGTDFVARQIADGVSGHLGAMIVDNRPIGPVAGEMVFRAPPDGHMLLLTGSSFWIGPLLQKVPYDPMTDFAPVTMPGRIPHILVVHPSVPATNVKALIALAKARPGELYFAAGGTGSTTQIAGEVFKYMAGVNIVCVPYKAAGLQMTDLIGGHVQLAFSTASTATPHIKSGRLRALGVTSAQPSPLAPGLQPIAASGLPGYESLTILGMFAPGKTPAPIVSRINQEIARFLKGPEAKERFFNSGIEAVADSPAHLAGVLKGEVTRVAKLIKDGTIKAEAP